MVGIDVIGADENTPPNKTTEALKKVGKGAASVVSDLLTDKPKDPTEAQKKAMEDKPKESFFSKAIVGPVKVWHAIVGVLVTGGGIYLWKRK